MASAAIKRAVPQEPYPGIEPLGGVVAVVSAQVEEGALVAVQKDKAEEERQDDDGEGARDGEPYHAGVRYPNEAAPYHIEPQRYDEGRDAHPAVDHEVGEVGSECSGPVLYVVAYRREFSNREVFDFALVYTTGEQKRNKRYGQVNREDDENHPDDEVDTFVLEQSLVRFLLFMWCFLRSLLRCTLFELCRFYWVFFLVLGHIGNS